MIHVFQKKNETNEYFLHQNIFLTAGYYLLSVQNIQIFFLTSLSMSNTESKSDIKKNSMSQIENLIIIFLGVFFGFVWTIKHYK